MIWEMEDGTKIDVKDMEESHIRNCIKMLEKCIRRTEAAQAEMSRLMFLFLFDDDYVESVVDEMAEEYTDYITLAEEQIVEFQRELENRKNEH